MNHQYKFYPASFVMRSKDPSTLRIFDIWKFKSTKNNKLFIIEMEHFDHNLIRVKFYYKGARWSNNRYSLMTNDNEPRTLVYTCFELMRRYYIKDNSVSFGFVAAADIDPVKKSEPGNRRFRVYRTLINNYFGPLTFSHHQDKGERGYLLLNNQQLKRESLTIVDFVNTVHSVYEEDFDFSWD